VICEIHKNIAIMNRLNYFIATVFLLAIGSFAMAEDIQIRDTNSPAKMRDEIPVTVDYDKALQWGWLTVDARAVRPYRWGCDVLCRASLREGRMIRSPYGLGLIEYFELRT